MSSIQVESPYYIFMNGGDKMYVLGRTGQYEEELCALPEKIDSKKPQKTE